MWDWLFVSQNRMQGVRNDVTTDAGAAIMLPVQFDIIAETTSSPEPCMVLIAKVVILAGVDGSAEFMLMSFARTCYGERLNGDGNEEKQSEGKSDPNSRFLYGKNSFQVVLHRVLAVGRIQLGA